MELQYITNEHGKQVGVLLDMALYHQLIAGRPLDPELLSDLNHEELEALANSRLAPNTQTQLNALLAQQKQANLSTSEEEELDRLLAQIDQLTILKTRARYTLQQQTHVNS